MNILAFDTCLGAVSASVRWRGPDGDAQCEACELRSAGHAERLMPMIAEVLAGAGLAFAQLDRIAVTQGPGGFTSVRVGIAAARALALATGKPVVTATSLAVMAHGAEEMLAEVDAALGTRRLTVAVDARRGTFYVQSFAAGGVATTEAQLLTPAEAVHSLGRDKGETAIVVGSGAMVIAALAREAGHAAEACLPELQPNARNLALMAADLAPVSPVKPLYLRLPDVRPQDSAALARTEA